MDTIVDALIVGRARRRLSLEEASKVLDISPATLSRTERGERAESITVDELRRIATWLDVDDATVGRWVMEAASP